MGIIFRMWTAITLFAVLLQCAGLVLFVLGFFPVKPALKGVSGIESLKTACYEEVDHAPIVDNVTPYQEECQVSLQYNRAVLMVIDGLPAEFVLGKDGHPPLKDIVAAMPLTQSLLSAKKAIGFHARAAPPTVTMPRLKAMTSGAIAGFLDVAFNFNTQALLDDNLIGQLKAMGWKIVMYGDETWLRLFPNAFSRQDGVSSFYVKDTVQVDENVTRHLDEELAAQDWDLLILHYLGLDHVGHLGGRASPLMAPKLKEMDLIIHHLHSSLIENNTQCETILMVVSDHGMTNGGNHGGASFEETDSLALFVTRKGFSKPMSIEVNETFQVDLVPTLALLFGVPIPLNNVGVMLPQLFNNLTEKEKLRALQLNAWQILRLLRVRAPRSSCLALICSGQGNVTYSQDHSDDNEIRKFCELFIMAEDLHLKWRESPCNKEKPTCTPADWEVAAKEYLSFLRGASNWLAKGNTEKNIHFIYTGGLLMIISAIILISMSFWASKKILQLCKSKSWLQTSKLENWIALAGVCGHAFSFTSSSLVEEEQFTLHFLVVTLLCCFLRRACQQTSLYQTTPYNRVNMSRTLLLSTRSCQGENNLHDESLKLDSPADYKRQKFCYQVAAIFVVLTAGRLLRSWHRSGVNWAHLPDVAKWLDQANPQMLLTVRVLALACTTSICCLLILEKIPTGIMQRLVAGNVSVAALLILLYNILTKNITVKASYQLPTLLAQLVYAILGSTALGTFLATPWIVSNSVPGMRFPEGSKIASEVRPIKTHGHQFSVFLSREEACQNFIGKVFVSCWCLLQLLLQQSVNTVPVLLLLLQLIFIIVFFNLTSPSISPWLKILTFYWLGASGHFGMGNTNTLATVDVAGAYIGLSHHSIFLSGVLAFIITGAAPLLFMLGSSLMVSFGEIKQSQTETDTQFGQLPQWQLEVIAVPCIVPLALSSVILVVFSMIMLLMQGHLFIWSVFSPKYIYVSFSLLSTYLGVLINAMVSLYTSAITARNTRNLFKAD